eukprot:4826997-Ditylum_brightwellii.AAC.1
MLVVIISWGHASSRETQPPQHHKKSTNDQGVGTLQRKLQPPNTPPQPPEQCSKRHQDAAINW